MHLSLLRHVHNFTNFFLIVLCNPKGLVRDGKISYLLVCSIEFFLEIPPRHGDVTSVSYETEITFVVSRELNPATFPESSRLITIPTRLLLIYFPGGISNTLPIFANACVTAV